MDTVPEFDEPALTRATVTTSVNHLDATSPAEREMLRTALQALIDLLFDLYAQLPETGSAAPDFSHDGLLVFPPAYVTRYDRPFVRSAIVAAASLGQKMAGASWFDLGSTMEEILFGTIMESVQNTDIEIGDVFDDLEDSIFQDLDYELLFSPQFDGIENGASAERYAFANLRYDEWFLPFPNTSYLNYYFADPRVLDETGEHRLFDPNAGSAALRYAVADDGDEGDAGDEPVDAAR
jgi:hypothetical protein